MKHFK